jgi:hypothetical protein
MYCLQLGSSWWVEINVGDVFVYKYSDNHVEIKQVRDKLDMNEYLVEILCLTARKHYILKRDNGYFWWEEINF